MLQAGVLSASDMSQQQEHVLRDNSDSTYTNDRKYRGIIGDGVTPIIVYNDIETDALSQVAVRSNDCIVLQKKQSGVHCIETTKRLLDTPLSRCFE